MKKIIYILVLSLFIFNCSKSDDDIHPLVGSWKYTETEENFVQILIFNADFSGSIYEEVIYNGENYEETESIIWSIENNILSVSFIEPPEDISVEYSITGNKLTITFDTGYEIIYTKF